MNNISKKTKIVCTIGPATESVEMLTKLVEAGMNVMRLNFSHGDFAEHQVRINNIKKVQDKTDMCVAVLQDLAGPKIRIGKFEKGSTVLKPGATFTITTKDIIGNDEKVSINYPEFAKEVKVGDHVLLHDGKKSLQVMDIKGDEVKCKVIVGGEIKDRRGVNLPDTDLSVPALTDKDMKDMEFGLKNKVDFFALSFVRRPEDIIQLREILKKRNSDAHIIAKVETPQAVANIDKIIELVDGIMVARGDLAIEIPAENVPAVQKMIIKKCNAIGKPVITATQMLESMIHSPVPTRAEVSDIANAILDGTDAIMLSEETTLGEFPVQAVEVMTRVAKKIEGDYLHRELSMKRKFENTPDDIAEAITNEAVDVADNIEAHKIVVLTDSGYTARMVSRLKPSQLIIALTPKERSARKMTLSSGVKPIVVKSFKTLDDGMKTIRATLVKGKFVGKGELVVVVAGIPFGKPGATNTILVEKI
ncbi:MAG: pyruvate kinase [bacterium]